ncbi:dTDP-4-dehydrorhamnose reductase [Paenibacillus cymbidii]|uniref:dTDP-4-dehydrorhamnose reductase n=1 Tax=Paenibacillus cymbidii TaxID=1639034 RepID=UPI00107FF216|nr:dTDP-4-dehydrorhamnose reductase [Paenibacillus cymbidii]
MRILITGGSGQLGTELTKRFGPSENSEVFSFSRSELDITDLHQVNSIILSIRPDVIFHTAAFTNVDSAEKEMERAFQVNAMGTRNVAVASQKVKSKLVYISTDYIFDGTVTRPYHEFDLPYPRNVYGRSKLAGEHFVQCLTNRFFIIRTSWLYGAYGDNFVKKICRSAQENKPLKVVNDQIGSPTYCYDLAEWLEILVKTEFYGVYHVSNSGACSWYEFAQVILKEINRNDLAIEAVASSVFDQIAPRPAFSVLDNLATRLNGLPTMRNWYAGLKHFLNVVSES